MLQKEKETRAPHAIARNGYYLRFEVDTSITYGVGFHRGRATDSNECLTAADTLIHFDPWWNPAAEAQATDRAHRIGQDKPVFVYKLVAAGSIEERILALQQRKAQLAEAVLGRDGEQAQKFSQEDIEALLAPLG